MIEVVQPGASTSVQGDGPRGRAHLGVSRAGPGDALAAARANRLVENRSDACVVEMVLQGAVLRFLEDARIAVCGAPFPLMIDDAPVGLDTPFGVRAGQVLRVGMTRRGLRCALAVRGGLDDGWRGRALAKGDVIGGASLALVPLAHPLPPAPSLDGPAVVRVTSTIETAWFTEAARAAFMGTMWRVLPTSDRRGVRLEGPPVEVPPREMVTRGVSAGAVQVPPSGLPIVLGVDQQTTGGYPCIAHVVGADVWRLGQARPGDGIRFETVDFEEARALLRARHDELR